MSNHGFRAIIFYCVYVANVSDLFKESINLSVRFGDFLGVLWGGIFVRLFFSCCFWQNHYNVGFLWEQGGTAQQAGPFPSSIPSFPSSQAEPHAAPFFPSRFCRAQLFSEPSAPLPNPIAVRSSQVGAGGSVARRHGTGILALSSPYLFGSVP